MTQTTVAVAGDLPYLFVDGEEACDPKTIEFQPGDEGLQKYFIPICQHGLRTQTDWRLVAALISQESKFNPRAVSPTGAKCLMQVKDFVARQWGVKNIFNTNRCIQAGTNHYRWGLKNLCNEYKGKTKHGTQFELSPGVVFDETAKLAIGMYNFGMGNIGDAQRIAVNQEKNPGIWNDIIDIFPLMRKQAKAHAVRETKPYVEGVLEKYAGYILRYPPIFSTKEASCNVFNEAPNVYHFQPRLTPLPAL